MVELARRLSAIVSIDMVGYSMMVATDLSGAVRNVRDINERLVAPEIAHWHGRLIHRAGDSWLVEFAAVADAIQFGLSVQELLGPKSPTPLRMGIHFGEVTADGSTLHGNGINIAVRLQGIARPGGIALSAAVHERLPPNFPCEIREIGPRIVKNIPEAVWVYRVVMRGEEDEPTADRGSAVDLAHQVPGLTHRPAVAVLPFENALGTQEHEYFSDGLADDIINGLSRVRWLPVIARNSTFAFKGAPIDVREVGRQLGARYVISGSVHVSDRRLQVQVWLNEADERRLVWSERYDREPRDLFAVRDEIALGIVGAIEPEFSRAEQFRSRTRPLESLDGWELVRRGLWHMNRLTREDAATARELFERALVRDPEFGGGAGPSLLVALLGRVGQPRSDGGLDRDGTPGAARHVARSPGRAPGRADGDFRVHAGRDKTRPPPALSGDRDEPEPRPCACLRRQQPYSQRRAGACDQAAPDGAAAQPQRLSHLPHFGRDGGRSLHDG